jgi:hypothetical protein
MRPSGPLPPRVYWARRLLVVVVVLALIAVAWQLLSSRGAASDTAGSSKPDASLSGVAAAETASPPTTAVTSSPSPTDRSGSRHVTRRHHAAGGHPAKVSSSPPTGPCAPTDVGITVEAAEANVGQGTVATLALTTLDGAVCTLQITPSSMVLRITSADAVVWTSDDCPNLLPARQVVVRPDPAATYRWRWDGRKSVQGCVSPGAVATAGHYEVEAALVGADIHSASFDISR